MSEHITVNQVYDLSGVLEHTDEEIAAEIEAAASYSLTQQKFRAVVCDMLKEFLRSHPGEGIERAELLTSVDAQKSTLGSFFMTGQVMGVKVRMDIKMEGITFRVAEAKETTDEHTVCDTGQDCGCGCGQVDRGDKAAEPGEAGSEGEGVGTIPGVPEGS